MNKKGNFKERRSYFIIQNSYLIFLRKAIKNNGLTVVFSLFFLLDFRYSSYYACSKYTCIIKGPV